MSIAQNLAEVKATLPDHVTLVAVSKTKPIEILEEAYHAGQRDFGENKVQEMAAKAEVLPKDINWHYIGHVQTNKIKYMAPFVHLVHGVDREKVLKELNKEAAKNNRSIDCLLQVFIAKEETKFGFDVDEIKGLFEGNLAETYPNLRVRGLMGMATFTEDAEQVRQEFRGLKQLFDEAKTTFNLEPSTFNILSMGMSGDYPIAIEEGSNLVRIGTAIFGSRG
jgi:pyridoxal phosphate enzyme (YggS family)